MRKKLITNNNNQNTNKNLEKLKEITRKKRKLDENNEIKEEKLDESNRKSLDQQPTNMPYYKCTRCDIKYETQIQLKAHYYDEHIDNEHKPTDLCTEPIVDHVPEDIEPSSIDSTTLNDTNQDKKHENGVESPRKKRKLDKTNAKTEKVSAKSEKNGIKQDDVDLSNLTDDQISEFNLDRIDEKELIENINKQKYNKKNDLLAGRVAWASWRKIMWPAMIERVIANKSGLLVFIRYYEGEKLGNKFKLDSSKVELFYKCKEHVKYKLLAAHDKSTREKFFIAYTNALNDYVKYNLNEDKSKQDENSTFDDCNNKDISPPTTTTDSNKKKRNQQKYFILGKQMSIDDIRKCANEDFSEEQLNENKKRVENSNKLVEMILCSDELKDHLIAIMKSEVDCSRHREYLKMNARARRKSIVNSMGPLVEDDQVKLGTYLRELCDSNYLDKPVYLDKYYFDVLYPEAVIWGLRKMHSVSYKEADKKFKQGFKQTNEEIKKRKCKEIMLKWSLSNANENNNNGSNGDGDDDEANSFVDSQFNEDDTSFFAYQQQTEDSLVPVASSKDELSEKQLSDSLPQLIN